MAALATVSALGCSEKHVLPRDAIIAFQAEQRFEETIPSLHEHLMEAPEDIELHRLLGIALLRSDSPTTAVWALRRAAEHPDRTTDDLLLLAQAYVRGGAEEHAAEICEQIFEAEPEHATALLVAMNAAGAMHHWEDVVAFGHRIIAVAHPGPPLVHHFMAEALVELERLEDAQTAITSGRASPASSQDPSIDAAFCQVELDLLAKRERLEEIPKLLFPCLARTRYAQGLVEHALELLDEGDEAPLGTEILATIVEKAPRRLEFRHQLAMRLKAEGQEQEALARLREATAFEELAFPAWMLVAQFHRELEDHEAAARSVERVLVDRETVPELALAEYGDDLVRAGELDKAEEVIQTLRRPEWVSLLRGRLLLERGEPAAALEALQEGIRLWPGNGTARLLAGRVAEQLGDFDQAILEYRNAVRSDIETTSAVYELAQLHEDEGVPRAAFFPLNVRLQRKPDDARAGLALARIALQTGNVPLAETTAAALGENGEKIAERLIEAMIARAKRGNSAAIRTLQAFGPDPSVPEHLQILEALVGYLIADEQSDAALALTQSAVEARPSSELYSLLAKVLASRGDAGAAARNYELALTLEPDRAEALSGFARLREADDPASAVTLYDRAFEADPKDPAAPWAAIRLQLDGGPGADFDLRLENLLREQPRHARAAELLARRLLERGEDLQRAEELSERALRFRGGGAQALETAGRIAGARGDTRRAVGLLRRSLEVRPRSPATRYHLALAQLEVGEFVEARRLLEQALAGGDFEEREAAEQELARLQNDPAREPAGG